MPVEEAFLIWNLFEFCSKWKLLESWKNFVRTKQTSITRDLWRLFLTFVSKHPTRESILNHFDSNECWPTLLDEFSTEWVANHN